MNNAEINAHRLMLKGLISDMPDEDQAKVAQAQEDLRRVVAKYGDLGVVALSLVSLDAAREGA